MKKRISLLLTLIIGLLAGCGIKDDPEETVINLLQLSGEINGQPIFLAPGGPSASFIETGFTQDSSDLLSFWGEIKAGCAACKESLKISLHNYQYTPGDTSYDINTAIKQGAYDIWGTTPKPYYRADLIHQGGNTTDIPIAYLWDLDSNNTSNKKDFSYNYAKPGIYNVRHAVFFSGGNQSTLNQNINLNPEVINSFLSFTYKYKEKLMLFQVITSEGLQASTYTWDFGDGSQPDTTSASSITHQYSNPGSYTVKVSTTSKGQPIEKVINLNYPSTLNKPVANFYVKAQKVIPTINPLSKISIQVTNKRGQVFESRLADQTGSSFTILSVSNNVLNDKGQKTKRIRIRFTCKVSNGITTMELKNWVGTFALAYK